MEKPKPRGTSQDTATTDYEKPKGRLLLYWGCSATVRPGQPRILDMATAGPQDFAKFFVGRYAPERGATSRPGHAIWPNEKDNQRVPKNASLQGEHAVSGEGVPPSLKFALGERQDFMERLNLAAPGDPKASINSSWNAVPNARAYFLSAMGGDGNDMILWSSSDVPEAGLGLMDYLSHSQIDQWVREKVLLPATTQQCAIPSGIFGTAGGAMLRGIAYGNELNLVHPPRPTDAKLLPAWNPGMVAARAREVDRHGDAGTGGAAGTAAEEGRAGEPARHPQEGDLRPLAPIPRGAASPASRRGRRGSRTPPPRRRGSP